MCIRDRFRTIVAYDGTRRVATLNNPLVTGAVAGQITPSNTTNAGAPGRAIGIYLHRIRRSLPLLPLDAPDVATANMPLTNNRQDNIQGAVYSIEIVNQGANYVVGQATITSIGGGAALLNITDVTPQGGITGIIITIPGTPPSSGFSVGQVLNVAQGVGINGTVRVTGTGYGVNVGTWDGTGAPTSAQPFGITNQGGIYTGQIFYLPSLNQPQSTPTGTTIIDPSAAQQFIVQNNTRVNLTNDEPYTNDSTASSIIRGDFFEANPPVGVNQAHFLVIDPFQNVFSGTAPGNGRGFEFNILPYDEDHVVPMNYTGSTVSQSQMVCYQMTLESITIPNVTITALGLGGLIAFYPYIYVEFRNESASSSQGNTPTLYSNNPASNTALWKCSITDTPTPLISKFIKIRADGMQTVKFKPNDDLYFKVTLPNGQTFETSTKDTAPPLLPNLLLQISFSVGIERL